MRFYYRQGASDCKSVRHMDWGGITLQTEKYSSLRIYFVIQIPAFIDWSCSVCRVGVCSHGLDDMEFAGRSSVH